MYPHWYSIFWLISYLVFAASAAFGVKFFSDTSHFRILAANEILKCFALTWTFSFCYWCNFIRKIDFALHDAKLPRMSFFFFFYCFSIVSLEFSVCSCFFCCAISWCQRSEYCGHLFLHLCWFSAVVIVDNCAQCCFLLLFILLSEVVAIDIAVLIWVIKVGVVL